MDAQRKVCDLKQNQLKTISIQFTGPTDSLSSSQGSPFNTTPINLILGDRQEVQTEYHLSNQTHGIGALLLHSPEFKGLKWADRSTGAINSIYPKSAALFAYMTE